MNDGGLIFTRLHPIRCRGRTAKMGCMIRFDPIPYPLWRRRFPAPLTDLLYPLWRLITTVDADRYPPSSPAAMAHFLTRWRLLPERMDAPAAKAALTALEHAPPTVESVSQRPAESFSGTIRLPAQWDRMEAVVVAFPVLYPWLWETHLSMLAAIAPVARVDVLIPDRVWALPITLHLDTRNVDRARVRFLHLPTDDIWVRDYGPVVGYDPHGQRALLSIVYDPLPNYDQRRDDAMALRYAAHDEIPARRLALHTEGGNIWSDGVGTLLMSDDIFVRNPGMTHDQLMDELRDVFTFDKLILTPYLAYEETGHIDLLCKLASADAVLVSAPTLAINGPRLRQTADLFRRETNASGQPYRVFELPSPPPYLNWGVYPVWRSYTNALTVNGRVLVPTFGIAMDQQALAVYRQAMPDHEVIGIPCRYAANGGGAVHCLTKEIPA